MPEFKVLVTITELKEYIVNAPDAESAEDHIRTENPEPDMIWDSDEDYEVEEIE